MHNTMGSFAEFLIQRHWRDISGDTTYEWVRRGWWSPSPFAVRL
jgi:hypothetical protein